MNSEKLCEVFVLRLKRERVIRPGEKETITFLYTNVTQHQKAAQRHNVIVGWKMVIHRVARFRSFMPQ